MKKLLQKVMYKKVDYDIAKIKEDAKINNRDVDYIVRSSYASGVYAGYHTAAIEHVCLCFKAVFAVASVVYVTDMVERLVDGCCKTQDAGNQKV